MHTNLSTTTVTQDFSAPPNITKQAGLQYIQIQAQYWNDTTGRKQLESGNQSELPRLAIASP